MAVSNFNGYSKSSRADFFELQQILEGLRANLLQKECKRILADNTFDFRSKRNTGFFYHAMVL